MPLPQSSVLIGPPAKRISDCDPNPSPNSNPTRICVPIEHAEAVQQLLWLLWLAALIEVTRSHHDGFCRKVAEAAYTNDNKLAKWTSYALDKTANTTDANGIVSAAESYRLVSTSSDGAQSITYYDNLQRTVRARTKTFSGGFAEATTEFDALGRQTKSTKPASSGATDGTAISMVSYDALNRPVTETLPDGNTATTSYNGLSTTVTRSNTNGTTGGSIQAHATTKTANAKGMVATVVTSPIATTLSYQYDALGALTKVTSPGNVVKTMVYDVRGRQTQLVDPDAGSYTYAYNGLGEQVSQTDARTPINFVTSTQYDPFGRKTTRSETQATGGAATTSWSYDCGKAKGLLCSVAYSGSNTPSDPTGTNNATSKSTTYDPYSRPSSTTTAINGQSFVSQIAYDALGRPKYSVYPQATKAEAPLSLETSYNAAGYVTQVRHAVTRQIYSQINTRNADG